MLKILRFCVNFTHFFLSETKNFFYETQNVALSEIADFLEKNLRWTFFFLSEIKDFYEAQNI